MSNLLRLIYASTANFAPVHDGRGIEVSVARILMQSRKNNPKRLIGGVLHYGDGYFFQCLEGPRDEVNHVYHTIAADSRHRDVELLSANSPGERLFRAWSMKYVPIEGKVQNLITRHGLTRFFPYEFNEALVDQLLNECVTGVDPTAHSITDAPPVDRRREAGDKPGLWHRLTGRNGRRL